MGATKRNIIELTMMNKYEITQHIWKSISGSSPLFKLYRYGPSLHDGIVKALDVECSERKIKMTVDYCDHPIDPDSETHVNTRITLCWYGIIEAKLGLTDNALYGIDFSGIEGGFKTEFEDYCYGLDGYILSQGIEVIGIEPTKDPSELDFNDISNQRVIISIT